MMKDRNHNTQSAWVQLYIARRQPPPPARTRPRGRPRHLIPRGRKTAFRFTDGEHTELVVWQERLSILLDRHISFGETVGILARICSARLNSFPEEDLPENLSGLVSKMVG